MSLLPRLLPSLAPRLAAPTPVLGVDFITADSVVVGPFLRRAAMRGERSIALARLGILSITLGRELLDRATGYSTMPRAAWLVGIGTFVAGIAFTLWSLVRLRRRPPPERLLLASVIVDPLMLFATLGAEAVWVAPGFQGLLRAPESALFCIAAVATGIRLTPSVAAVGIVANFAGASLAVALDLALNRGTVTYGAPEIVTAAIAFAGSAGIGAAVAMWTRRLVSEGARASAAAERARQRLGTYVSAELADEILRPPQPQSGGRRQDVAVLFSDLRGFTRYAEPLPPERLVAELNGYLEAMVAAVRSCGGVVDKYIGDSIMAVFGVPDPRPDDALRAVQTARAMERALDRHNKERARAGLPPLAHGIGVHFGPAVAGSIGPAERLQYTVVGDTVNVASRLEAATKQLGTHVLVSAQAALKAREAGGAGTPPLRPVGTVPLRGREQTLEIWTFDDGEAAPAPAPPPG